MKNLPSPRALQLVQSVTKIPAPVFLAARACHFLLLVIGMVLALSAVLQAQTDGTWNTTVSGVWSDTDNWVTTPTSGTVPGGAGSTVWLTYDSGGFTSVTIDTTSRTVGILNLGDADGTADRHLAVSGGATLTLDNGGSAGEINFIGRANTITTTVNLASDVTMTNSSTNSSGIYAFTASTVGLKTITNSGTGIGGVILGATGIPTTDGAGTVAIRQNSATSVLTLNANNGSGFSGGLAIDAGKVRMGTTNSQGVGDVTMADGTAVSATGSGGSTHFGSIISVNGDVTLGDSVDTRGLTLSGGITLTGDRTLTVASDVSATGAIGESGSGRSLTKEGAGTLTFGASGGNAYTGSTIINEGTLRLSTYSGLLANTDITLNNGSVLDMTNVNSGVGPVVVNSGTITGTRTSGQIYSGDSFTVSSGAINANIGGGGTVPLTKTGTGTFTLSGVNAYTGTTTVNAGTLIVSGSGSINSTSEVNVTGGKFQYDSSTGLTRSVTINGGSFAHNSAADYTGGLTFTAGTLAGTNWNGNLDGISIGSGQVISPGNSPGTATTGDQTWAGSGSYIWEINNATGTPGADPGWDLLSGTGALTLTATSGDKFNINVTSLTLGNVAGDANNFNSASSYEWMIADFASAISTFDASAFNIDTSAFSNANTGLFSIARGDSVGGDNTELYLVYSAIPEPTTLGLLGLSLTVLVALRRRRVA